MIVRAPGIDVSHHQGEIDWGLVASDPKVKFAIIRTGHGRKEDRQFRRNWREARKRDRVVLGVYHYFDHWVPTEEQAKVFLGITHEAGVWDGPVLPPVGDFEHGPIIADSMLEWLLTVERDVGLCPWIYTGIGWWSGKDGPGDDLRFARYPLWVADYTPPTDVPFPWTDWIIHQHTDKGRVQGIKTNVDLNVFNGDVETLRWMARSPDVYSAH